jgi:hypothetical protein
MEIINLGQKIGEAIPPCHPKMIMSSFAKIEMSSFSGVIMLFSGRRHYGRRGVGF